MKVWILTEGKKKWSIFPYRRFREEFLAHGCELELINARDLEIIEPLEKTDRVLYKSRYKKLPDVVIPRMGSAASYISLAGLRQLENLGVFVLNNAESIELARDKLHSIQVLAQNNIPLPKTMLARMPLDPEWVKKHFHFPLIVKTIAGSQGKGVLLCDQPRHLEDLFHLVGKTNDERQILILQEFISASKGKDLRVFVIGGRAIGAMLREAGNEGYKANFSRGGSVSSFPLNQELEWLAVESAKSMNLDIAGVDILMDKDGYRVCEVNSSPGFEGFEQATDINIPLEILRFILLKTEGHSLVV
ncbi:RimK family alpha-L-glutamate ligase [Candidatus Peregrinibacteria bacterium]|nr:RimK family alpha-L-glutamate ligase [bacterium]NCQ55827.1 RimK family alpha-L-glutamate ligase [Candidatus Parcubacteria bacterium]NCS67894.1 RimK family alpha-L-glutamate ligase [Candidatus Peregrinibacteria bacterium]